MDHSRSVSLFLTPISSLDWPWCSKNWNVSYNVDLGIEKKSLNWTEITILKTLLYLLPYHDCIASSQTPICLNWPCLNHQARRYETRERKLYNEEGWNTLIKSLSFLSLIFPFQIKYNLFSFFRVPSSDYGLVKRRRLQRRWRKLWGWGRFWWAASG